MQRRGFAHNKNNKYNMFIYNKEILIKSTLCINLQIHPGNRFITAMSNYNMFGKNILKLFMLI